MNLIEVPFENLIQDYNKTHTNVNQDEYHSTLATSTLIIIFSKMLRIFKNILLKVNFMKEIKESFEIFKKYLFFNMESSKLINYFKDMLKLPLRMK